MRDGKGEKDIRNAHEDVFYYATKVTGNQANRCSQYSGDDDDREADGQGNSPAKDDAAEDIPAKLIGSQQVCRRRRLKTHIHYRIYRIE